MNNKSFLKFMKSVGACEDAIEWVAEHGGDAKDLWRDCERGDWMGWILVKGRGEFEITRQQIVPALCDCAELSLHFYEEKYPNNDRPRKAIETARLWAQGKATDKEMRSAASAAFDAAYAASASYADAAAFAASYAADAAYAAASYADAASDADAADAAFAASYAADAASDAASYAAAASYADAAFAASDAADAASDAASAASAAFDAAYAASASDAADAASDAAYTAARAKTLKKCADIFRKHFPNLDL